MALIDNIVSYWKTDESSGNAADSVGSNTLVNTNVTYGTGIINNGAVFNNVNTTILTDATPTGLPSGNGAFTVSFWVYRVGDSSGDGSSCYQWGTDSTKLQNASFIADSDYAVVAERNKFIHYFYGADLASTASISTGVWTYIAVTWDGTTRIIYINGSSSGSDTPTSINVTVAVLNLGVTTASTRPMNGTMDEIGIWSRALSSTEITTLYNGGAGLQYPFGGSGPSNLKSLDTNVKANIKSYNTNVLANIKSINTNA